MMRSLTVLACVLVLLAPVAQADEIDELLAQAERLFNELEYNKAIHIADRILQTPDVSPEKLVEAYRIKGLSLSGDDRIDDAFMVFRQLMAISPRYQLSKDVSPRLAAPFYQAAAIAGEEGVVDLAHIEPADVTKLAGLELTVHVKANPYKMIKQIRLRYRTPENEVTGELKQPMTGKKADLTFRLPDDLKTEALLYHFEALNQYGGVVGRSGSGAHPYRLQVTKGAAVAAGDTGDGSGTVAAADGSDDPKADDAARAATTPPPDDLRDDDNASAGSKPFWKTWWFWTAVGGGVAVIAGATTAGVLLSGGDSKYTYQIRADLP